MTIDLSPEERLLILLVDDDAVDRMAVRRALRSAGLAASLVEADDATSALTALQQQSFDCALFDLRLPGRDGLELLRQVRADGVGTPVIMLTGQGDEQTAVTLMKAGAVDYIPKGALTPERLGQSIRHAVRVRRAERETQRYAAQLRGLSEAAVAASAYSSLEAGLRALTDHARVILGAGVAVTRTLPDTAAPPAISRSERHGAPEPVKLPSGALPVSTLQRMERPVRLTRAELDASPSYSAIAAEAGLPARGWLAAPLIARDGRVLGLIHLSDKHDGEWSEQDEAILVQLARMAAAAVENTMLFERAERAADRTARLQEITAGFSEARTSAEVTDVVVTQVSAASGARASIVALLTEHDTSLELVRMHGYPADVVATWRHIPMTVHVPLVATARTGDSFFFGSVEEMSAHFPAAIGTRYPEDMALASVPLIVEGRRIGALGLAFATPRVFSEEDQTFISASARQCAGALERARLYEAESHARAEAEAANRAKDEFLSTLSHELRTPLSAILGWSHMLRAKKSDPAFVERALATIERNAKAQSRLIEDILDVSRIVAGKLRVDLRPVEFDPIVRAAVDAVRPTADAKGIAVSTDFDSGLAVVLNGDLQRLQQVVWNLLSNAIKFTPKGGHVEVRFGCRKGQAELCVTDSGQGIAPEFLPHVFERFKQADASSTRAQGGLGLGLAIAKHIIELHGGSITAESAGLGRGASFRVTLPVAAGEGDKPALAGGSAPDFTHDAGSVSLGGVRILVVDDETDARELLATVLRERGAEVKVAASAAEALELITNEVIDVLISDIGMPGQDGYSLMERARSLLAERERSLPALALTAYAGAQDARRAYRVGFQMHLAKPFMPDQLVEVVARLAGRGVEHASRAPSSR